MESLVGFKLSEASVNGDPVVASVPVTVQESPMKVEPKEEPKKVADSSPKPKSEPVSRPVAEPESKPVTKVEPKPVEVKDKPKPIQTIPAQTHTSSSSPRTPHSTGSNGGGRSMSGVGVDEMCVSAFDKLLREKATKFVVYKINGAGDSVEVETVGSNSDDFDEFLDALPESDCRYAVYDFLYTNADGCVFNKVRWLWILFIGLIGQLNAP